jgi:hypothetical protein
LRKADDRVPANKTPAEAFAHLPESRRGVTLGGLKIEDLVHEGGKYRWRL